ncbi:MAG: cell division protein ZapE [gamma proteobacterium symbiont of Taylorina sp.]|nr:cell division protein ZapE [gamma proteobacterium symbiont of Taylorina sp.]
MSINTGKSLSSQISFAETYQNKIDSGLLITDSEQQCIVQKMQLIYEEIETLCYSNSNFNMKNLLSFSLDKLQQSVQGIYLWGGVGRGKTFLLDMFFECLTFNNKLRLHFHRFMQIIHESIEELGDIENPLKQTAKNLAQKYKVIYLDEVAIIDIADAMILAELLKYLISNDVILLFTSNTVAENLYKNGLQRARFLPAIDLISACTVIIEIKGDEDYRLNALERVKVYQLTSAENTDTNLQGLYDSLSGGIKLHQDRDDLMINYRHIPVKKWESGIVWFSFDMLCNTHRDSSDYIHIAAFFHTVIISDIYCLNTEHDDIVRRFINLIDIFYDRHINVIISAQTTPDQLYSGKRLQFEFSRTRSRLVEMQTKKYLSKNKKFKVILENKLFNMDLNKDKVCREINDPTRFGDWVSSKGRCSDF